MKQKSFRTITLMFTAIFSLCSAAVAGKSLGTHGDFLRSKIAASSPLSEEEKTVLVEFAQGQYQNGVSFKDKWNSDWVRFFQETANDPSQSLDTMKEAVRNYWKQKREENKASIQEAHQNSRDLRAKMREKS